MSKGTGDSSARLEVRGDTVSKRIVGAEIIANFFMVLEDSNFRVRISQERRVPWQRILIRGMRTSVGSVLGSIPGLALGHSYSTVGLTSERSATLGSR